MASLGLLLAGGVVALTVSSSVVPNPWLNGVIRGVGVASWILAGLLTWSRGSNRRLGRLLTALAVIFAASALAVLPEPGLYMAGRVFGPVQFVLLAYLFLAYPTGRLADRSSAIVVRVAAVATAALWLPLLLGGAPFPPSSELTRCRAACPENPIELFALSTAAADVLAGLTSLLLIALLLSTTIITLGRLRSASAASRPMLLAPAVWICAASLAYAVSGIAHASAGADAPVATAVGWVAVAIAVTFPYAFVLGQVHGRLFSAAALRQALSELTRRHDPDAPRDVLARALRDPTLEICLWSARDSSYVDAAGRPTAMSVLAGERAVKEVRQHGRPVAAILHDPALRDNPGLLDAAGDAALLAIENDGLELDLRTSIEQLQFSRARIAAAGAEERRRMERELHDSAQNRLVGLQIRLRLALERIAPIQPDMAATLADLGEDAEAAVADLRRIAHGIAPPLLADRGLAAALAAATTHSGIPVSVEADDLGLSRPEVELAVYLCCLESVQNAAKHGGRGVSVAVRLRLVDHELAFSFRDDGGGFDPDATPEGEGLTGIRDRIGSVGGRVELASVPGRGVTVAGAVPWPARGS